MLQFFEPSCSFCILGGILWTHPIVLRDGFWLCSQKWPLMGSGTHMWCWDQTRVEGCKASILTHLPILFKSGCACLVSHQGAPKDGHISWEEGLMCPWNDLPGSCIFLFFSRLNPHKEPDEEYFSHLTVSPQPPNQLGCYFFLPFHFLGC